LQNCESIQPALHAGILPGMDGRPLLSCLALALFAVHAGGALRGEDEEPRRFLLKDGIQVRLDEAYILEGRVKVERGEAWLRVELLSPKKTLAPHETPRVQPGPDWTYAAVEGPRTWISKKFPASSTRPRGPDQP